MKPYEHQIDIANKAFTVLKKYGLVYLAMEERTGKTLTSILVAEKSNRKYILVITKKKAIAGWEDTLAKFNIAKKYDVINYESIHKLPDDPYDMIIIDEAHANLSKYPQPGKLWLKILKFTRKKPLIFLSATPSAQTYAQLYNQLRLSSWSPWNKYRDFYRWFEDYGIPEVKFIGGRELKVYSNIIPEAYEDVKHLFITYTRQELGFKHEPNDIIHYVELDKETKKMYNELMKHKMIESIGYIADSPMKLMVGLHQIEGGTLKNEEEYTNLQNVEKCEYIRREFGDSSDIVIFYHYKSELKKLESHFNKARILQATSFAEGVDLSMYKTLIVYSMDFSTARYTQRRARQCNMKRGEPIDVHFLLVNGGISEQVYETVAVNKKNFVNSYFNKEEL